MSALAGVFDPDAERADIERELARMRQALEVPPTRLSAELASAPGAGCVHLESRAERRTPCVARDDGGALWLMFAGELYGVDELRARLPAAAPDGDAQLCLHLYLQEGADFIRHLNGHFNVVLYHLADRHLSIATDPFGYRPLFLAAVGKRLLFASEMKAILAVCESTPAVDGIGLLQLARQGWPLGDRTWLEPIQLAAPGAWYEITSRGMQRRRHFRFGYRHRDGALSLTAYVEGFAEKLRQAVQRATADSARMGLALSGGLDSRSLLLAADGRRGNLLAYTFGRAFSRDVRYAAQLAQVAAVPHVHLPYDAGYLGRLLAPLVWRSEGLLPFSEATFTSLHFHAALAKRVDVLLYGHGGDALTGAHLPPGILLRRSREQLIARVFRQYSRVPDALLQRVFRPSFYRRFAPDLHETLRATFADIDQEELADVLDVWDIENRQRRGTFSSAAMDRYRFGVRAPFLERDLVDHLRQAPPSWRVQQRAYKQMIVTAFAGAAAVPWAHTGARLHTLRLADFASLAGSYVRRRLPPTWAPRMLSGTHAPDFRDLCADTRADRGLAQSIRAFAASSSFPAEVFDRAGIEEVVRHHWEGRLDLTHLVSMLATFATAYRLLLWQRPQAIPAEAVPTAIDHPSTTT